MLDILVNVDIFLILFFITSPHFSLMFLIFFASPLEIGKTARPAPPSPNKKTTTHLYNIISGPFCYVWLTYGGMLANMHALCCMTSQTTQNVSCSDGATLDSGAFFICMLFESVCFAVVVTEANVQRQPVAWRLHFHS